jgi:hypothetical protein
VVNMRKAAGNAIVDERAQGEAFGYGGGSGAATLERTTPEQALDQLAQYVANAHTILTEKGQATGFDIGTTTVGSLILFCDGVLAYLKEWAPTWSGDTPTSPDKSGGQT